MWVLLSPALGLFVFTQLALILAFIFGVGYTSISLALLLTVVLSLFCFLKFKQEFLLKNISVLFLSTIFLVISFPAILKFNFHLYMILHYWFFCKSIFTNVLTFNLEVSKLRLPELSGNTC